MPLDYSEIAFNRLMDLPFMDPYPLPQLHPKHHQTGIGVPPAHVLDELDLLWTVLVRVAVRPVGTIFQRLQRTVIELHPAVDVLPVSPVPFCRFCDSIFLCVVN